MNKAKGGAPRGRPPIYPGRCDMCGGPLPDEPDLRVSLSRRGRICSRRCQNRERHRAEYRRDHPEAAEASECHRKVRYPDREHAERVIVTRTWLRPVRPYQCPWCGDWHIGRY